AGRGAAVDRLPSVPAPVRPVLHARGDQVMEILSWNIQCGRGVDGRVDLARIARTIRAFGDPDVICLQEVARGMAELGGGGGLDQVAELGRLFHGYELVFGPALDRRGKAGGPRRQYGNLI